MSLLDIFTDGSLATVSEAKPQSPANRRTIGAAAAVYFNGAKWCTSQIRMTASSSTETEIKGIELALGKLKALGRKTSKNRIHLDSQCAIQSLKRPKNLQQLLVREQLSNFPYTSVYWVRGHNNNEGNEQADKVARAASSRATRSSFQTIVSPEILINRIKTLPEAHSDPLVLKNLRNRREEKTAVRFWTNHSSLNDHVKAHVDKTQDERCRFCHEIPENVPHLWTCSSLPHPAYELTKGGLTLKEASISTVVRFLHKNNLFL